MMKAARVQLAMLVLAAATRLCVTTRDLQQVVPDGNEGVQMVHGGRHLQQGLQTVSCYYTNSRAFVDEGYAEASQPVTGSGSSLQYSCYLASFNFEVRDTYQRGSEFKTFTYTLSGNIADGYLYQETPDTACPSEAEAASIQSTWVEYVQDTLQSTTQRRWLPFSPQDICSAAACTNNMWVLQRTSTTVTPKSYQQTSCCTTDNCNPGSVVNVTTPKKSKKVNAGAIAGGVIGGLAGLAIIAGIVFCVVRSKNQRQRKLQAHGEAGMAMEYDPTKLQDPSKLQPSPPQAYVQQAYVPVQAQMQAQAPAQQQVPMQQMYVHNAGQPQYAAHA